MFTVRCEWVIFMNTLGRHTHWTHAPFSLPPICWVGVGWQRHCKTGRSLRELDNQGTFCFFRRSPTTGCRVTVDQLCEVNNIYSARVGMIVSRSVYGMSLKRQLHSTPIADSGNSFSEN